MLCVFYSCKYGLSWNLKVDIWFSILCTQSCSQFSVYLQANQTFNEIFQTMKDIYNGKKTTTTTTMWSTQKYKRVE